MLCVFQSAPKPLGAGASNLHLSSCGSAACQGLASPQGFVDDHGANNRNILGHRQWLMHPCATNTAYGVYGGSSAQYVFGPRVRPDWSIYPTWTSWPAAGRPGPQEQRVWASKSTFTRVRGRGEIPIQTQKVVFSGVWGWWGVGVHIFLC